MFETAQVIIVAAFFVGLALFAVHQWRRTRAPTRKRSTAPGPLAPRTAGELHRLVDQLSRQNAMWPQILSTLDPANDSKVSALLVRLRGPHMFAPHLALGVLRTGCEAVRPDASAQEAIKAAVDSMDKVLKFGD